MKTQTFILALLVSSQAMAWESPIVPYQEEGDDGGVPDAATPSREILAEPLSKTLYHPECRDFAEVEKSGTWSEHSKKDVPLLIEQGFIWAVGCPEHQAMLSGIKNMVGQWPGVRDAILVVSLFSPGAPQEQEVEAEVAQTPCPPFEKPLSKVIRFPFGFTPAWTMEDHQRCDLSRAPFVFRGTVVDTTENSSFLLDIGTFQGSKTYFSFDGDEGTLFEVDIHMEAEECDEAAGAFFSAVALIRASYKGKETLGRDFKSTRCKDFMQGDVSYRKEGVSWAVRAGTFWSDGKFVVSIGWVYKPTEIRVYRGEQEKSHEVLRENLRKL